MRADRHQGESGVFLPTSKSVWVYLLVKQLERPVRGQGTRPLNCAELLQALSDTSLRVPYEGAFQLVDTDPAPFQGRLY